MALPTKMSAVIFSKEAKHGMLFVEDREVQLPSPLQVLIKVHASSLNHEFKMYKLVGNSMTGKGAGWDVAGTVVAVGSKVTTLAVGDAVFGQCDMGKKDGGGLCQYAVTQAAWVAKKPDGVSWAEAACLGVAGRTSLLALEATGVKAGDKLLLVGGSGGCGMMGVQMAKIMGAHVTTISSDANLELCKSLGADVAVSYSGGETSLKAALQAQAPFDCAYDTVSIDPPYEHIVRPVLKKGGLLVAINGAMSDFARAMFSGCINLQRRNFRILINVPTPQTSQELARIAAWVAEKKLKVIIDSTLPFTAAGIAEGYDKIVSRRPRGKIVVVMTE